jgi:hypothetical protein
VRLDSGNVVCGGYAKNILLFDKQFNKISSKPLSGSMESALLVGNFIYCGLGDNHIIVFDNSINEINRVKLSRSVCRLYCMDSNNNEMVAL